MTESKAARTKPATSSLTHDAIEERARAIYLAQGALPGRDLENWLQAERELRDEQRQGRSRRARR